MTDSEFMDCAERLLQDVERGCDAINDDSDADIDNQRVGRMVTLTFSDGSQIVINLQKPLHEVWMAAKCGGFHYRHANGQWRDTKTGAEFFEDLSRCAAAQARIPLLFAPNV